MNEAYNIDSNDRFLLYLSMSFDAAQKNVFIPLLTGGAIYLFENNQINYRLIVECLKKEKITIINSTPSGFIPILQLTEQNMYAALKSLRLLFLGGETLNINSYKKWTECPYYQCLIVNVYGPTECTDIVSYYNVTDPSAYEDNIPIGRPISNAAFYILDERKEKVPKGEIGGLYVGGIPVALGYL